MANCARPQCWSTDIQCFGVSTRPTITTSMEVFLGMSRSSHLILLESYKARRIRWIWSLQGPSTLEWVALLCRIASQTTTNTSVQTLPYNPPVINYHHTPMAPKLALTASMASSATSKAPAKTTKDKKKFSKAPADGEKRKCRMNCKKTYSSYTYKGMH